MAAVARRETPRRAGVSQATNPGSMTERNPNTDTSLALEQDSLDPVPMTPDVNTELDLSKLSFCVPENAPVPVVLLLCGSFSPPTLWHMRILEDAKDAVLRFPSGPCTAIGAFVSPAHQRYAKNSLAPMQHRLEMVRQAVADSDWITADSWECSQKVGRCGSVCRQRLSWAKGSDGGGEGVACRIDVSSTTTRQRPHRCGSQHNMCRGIGTGL